MSTARLVITAVVLEGRSQAEVARAYGVSPGWVSRLVARWRAEGEAALEQRSRRPLSSPGRVGAGTVELIIALRQQLASSGHDAGPVTIAWHLRHHHGIEVAASTIARYLSQAGLVQPAPRKRPKSSWTRFEAAAPNECWQADFTHYRLVDDTDVEILTFLDDHSRYAIRVTCHAPVTGPAVLEQFRAAIGEHGEPASTLTDNGMVFTTRLAGGRRGRNAFETELARRGITQKNSRPNHPTTCGKVERFQQTMKKWLTAQRDQPDTVAALQDLVDEFVHAYNHHRPHRALPHHATPATAYHAIPKATPGEGTDPIHRIRRDIVDDQGKVTVRVGGRMHHIGIGRTHARTPIVLLIDDLHVRIAHAATGELLRELTINPDKDYQPTGKPKNPGKR
jgi:transposase InsO family protein